MRRASLAGRLAIGAGAAAMTFAASASLTTPARATVHQASMAASRAPRVSSVTPGEGASGWQVILAGHRLGNLTSVRFGTARAAFTIISSTRIAATVPAGAVSGPVTVTGVSGRGRSPAFTVTPQQALEPGETLPPEQSLVSADGHYTLTMASDGGLDYGVTGTRQVIWSSGTAGHPGAYLTMLSDGNLVIYAAGGTPALWASGTAGAGPARLVAQRDGNLVVSAGTTAAWAAGSYDSTLEPGESLQPGWFLTSGTGYRLTMRQHGNLADRGPGRPWSSETGGHPGATLTMAASGNLAVRDSAGGRVRTLWASRTAGHPGARLRIGRDGILTVGLESQPLWASGRPRAAPLTLGKWAGRTGPGAAAAYYGYPYPDPPACTGGQACIADRWAFYRGQCTSWVAYRLNQLNNVSFANSFGGRGNWGNAVDWAHRARELGITVNTTPAVGSIAWYGATKAAPDGHVAYVEAVSSPTDILISEMNYDADNGFWVHVLTRADGDWPTGFIHLADR